MMPATSAAIEVPDRQIETACGDDEGRADRQ